MGVGGRIRCTATINDTIARSKGAVIRVLAGVSPASGDCRRDAYTTRGSENVILARFLNGYYDFAHQPDPYSVCWGLVQALDDHIGPSRLVWGSDLPHIERTTGHARSQQLVRRDVQFERPGPRADPGRAPCASIGKAIDK
jgi:hypothetical protein